MPCVPTRTAAPPPPRPKGNRNLRFASRSLFASRFVSVALYAGAFAVAAGGGLIAATRTVQALPGAAVRQATATPSSRVAPPAASPGPYDRGTRIASVDARFIDEASGIAVSRRNPGIIWLHNDSGDGAYLYAVDRKGKTAGVFLVRSASATDWEDMAWGPGPDGKGNFLYIGDIGDNGKNRTDCTVYRVPEPKIIPGKTGSKTEPILTEELSSRRGYSFPDGPHNAETLMVHPKTGIVYIVTKEEDGKSAVYKFPAEPTEWWERNRLIKVADVTIAGEAHPYPNLVTGGAISPDGKKVILRTYAQAYEWRLPAAAGANFDAIWSTAPTVVPTPIMLQGEAITYSPDGKSLLTTSEKAPAPIYELRAKGG